MKINSKKIVFITLVIISAIFNILLYSSIGSHLIMRSIWGAIGLCLVLFQAISISEYFKTKKIINLVFYIICTFGSIAGTVGIGWTQIKKVSSFDDRLEIDNNIQAIDKVFKTSKKLNQWAVISMLKTKKDFNKEKIDVKRTEKKISSSLSGIADLLKIDIETIGLIFLIFSALTLEMMIFGTALPDEVIEEIKKKKKRNKISKIEKEMNQGQLMIEEISE